VTVRLRPSEDSEYRNLTAVTVYGPDGTQIDANITSSRAARFTTAGAGVHHVRATYTNLDGDQFTTTFRVKAGSQGLALPASVRVVESPTGTYALVGDGLESGDVTVQQGGAQTSIVAQIPEGGDVPSKVRVHTEGLSAPPTSTLHVQVVRGDEGEPVSRNVRVEVYGAALPDDALLYRNGDPLPRGDSPRGIVNASDGGTARITTYTAADGSVTIETNSDPSWWDRVQYRYARTLPELFSVAAPPVSGGAKALAEAVAHPTVGVVTAPTVADTVARPAVAAAPT
jgi:hypothetical protein